MAETVGSSTSWIAGISLSEKNGVANSYAFGRAIDHRSEPTQITLNPRTELDSGSTVTDLPMVMTRACTRTFAYGDEGHIYQSTAGGAWSLVHTAANSQGNGMEFFAQDNALYYTQDTTFGRLLDACTASEFYDDFKSSEGGDPTNTKSINFEASDSMYASRADTASLSITSDLTLEAYIKPESLPAEGDTMTLVSKWDENGDLRSYKMDFGTLSDFFGDGGDGALTISSNTTEAPIDSACSGTAGSYSLSATNASFAADQKIMIHQTRGTNAGVAQYTTILSYTAGTITTTDALSISFNSTGSNKAQVRVLKQYTDVTINAGITYTAKAWNGTTGGILGFYSNGTTTINGAINASEKGFRGGITGYLSGASRPHSGASGEGNLADRVAGPLADGDYGGVVSPSNNTSHTGGGGGRGSRGADQSSGGGGGGHAGNGVTGSQTYQWPSFGGGNGGYTSGSAILSTITFGGGGGGGGKGKDGTTTDKYGGNGGGIVLAFGATVTGSGSISCNGGVGSNGGDGDRGGAGGGAGGSILFKAQTATLTNLTVRATGGAGGTTRYPTTIADGNNNLDRPGGAGNVGRIHLDYSTAYAGGSISPAISTAVDQNLNTGDGYSLRLQISDDGAAINTYTQEITEYINLDVWASWAITWEDTTSTANFYKDGTLIGTKTGTMTSIDDNASVFAVAADFDTTAQNFFDGRMDSVRVWNDVRTANELNQNRNHILYGTESNLVAYYQFEDNVEDSQSDGNNDLTAANTPTYDNDVPFSGVTTRADEDQKNDQTGQTYTLATAITETATTIQTFVPEKDPQKSVEFDIGAIGTGNWTLTVHDSLNRTVASVTVANAQLHTGVYEFTYASVWRPIIDASYHFHLTSTVADGTVVTGTTADFETARYWSHYQFLISDEYHPMKEMLDFMAIGNERYVGKLEAGGTFDPHKLTFPSGYRVRCLAYWREFLVIGCWKGTAITDYDDGRIFFWDGIKDTYNYSIPVPEGGINTMFGTQDVLFIVAGYSGDLLIYSGGGSAQKFNKIPKITRTKYVEIAPNAMNMWKSMIHVGSNLNTDSTEIHQGVYTIGTTSSNYPISLGFDYPLSLGDQTDTNVKVGVVYPSGTDLYIGWQNYNTFGIDKVAVDNDVYDSGTLEFLITDMGMISKEKYPLTLRADFKALIDGQKIRLKYKIDRSDDWSYTGWEDSVNATEIRKRIKQQCQEIQVGVDFETTVSTGPTLIGVTLDSDNASGDRHV